LLALEWTEEWGWNSEFLADSEAWLPPIPYTRIATILSENQQRILQKPSVKIPNPWEIFAQVTQVFEVTRTSEEEEIEKAVGFAAGR